MIEVLRIPPQTAEPFFSAAQKPWHKPGPRHRTVIGDVGWLTYWKGHDDGRLGFQFTQPDVRRIRCYAGRSCYDSLYDGEHVPVIAYRLSNGQGDEYFRRRFDLQSRRRPDAVLRSLSRQTDRYFEIVVADDGSEAANHARRW